MMNKINNMEPEKKCHCACHLNVLNKPYEHDTKCCDDMNGFIPEKKDVWEEEIRTRLLYALPDFVGEADVEIAINSMIDLIQTHFIPRSEVVEKIEAMEMVSPQIKPAFRVLLDLLTQEK